MPDDITNISNDQHHVFDEAAQGRAERAQTVRERLAMLTQSIDEHMIEIGLALEEIQREQYWLGQYPTFAAFIQDYVGMSMRKVQELLKVIRRCGAVGISTSEMASLGWSKLAIVAGDLTPENASQLVADVKSMSCRELKAAHEQKAKTDGRKKPQAKQRGALTLTEVVDEALRLASVHTRDVALQSNLEFMAAKFLELCPLPSRIPEPVMN